ncbi:hypothetical protein SAMN05444484_102522 [Flavobacterium chilense]|uniref:Uncharacterized protein n=2 Tax=Flavobacterium chilense TaxID=946677 RepID=A0A1M7DCL9_9FLAO|nr:hypothetical protein SAMN05444484_102522 [Flavobacterium chilense]
MKKAALTFGLFSLVMVATSFANPTKSDTNKGILNTLVDTDGSGATGKQKKGDYYPGNNQIDNKGELKFDRVNQSVRTDKKVD